MKSYLTFSLKKAKKVNFENNCFYLSFPLPENRQIFIFFAILHLSRVL